MADTETILKLNWDHNPMYRFQCCMDIARIHYPTRKLLREIQDAFAAIR